MQRSVAKRFIAGKKLGNLRLGKSGVMQRSSRIVKSDKMSKYRVMIRIIV